MNPTNETGATEFLANLSVGTVVLVALALTVARLMLLRPVPSSRPGGHPEVPSFARGIAEVLESLTIASVLVFLIIRPFFVQAFFIPSQSMEPTLMGHDEGPSDEGVQTDTVHDHIFVNKLLFRYSNPSFGDIIVFKAPKAADSDDAYKGLPLQENVLIKRLIGLPGDTIEVKPGVVTMAGGQAQAQASVVYRNGKPLVEPYTKEPMTLPQVPNARFGVVPPFKPLHLGPDQLFVMGDNRNDSNDSRFWGPLERSRVIGKAVFIFWPIDRIRLLHLP